MSRHRSRGGRLERAQPQGQREWQGRLGEAAQPGFQTALLLDVAPAIRAAREVSECRVACFRRELVVDEGSAQVAEVARLKLTHGLASSAA